MATKPASDFSQPASDIANASLAAQGSTGAVTALVGKAVMPPPPSALPNINNYPQLTQTQSTNANNAMRNFIKSLGWPPTTNADREKMKAAIKVYKEKIQATKKAAAKKAKGNTPVALLDAQKNFIGKDIPEILVCLPSNYNPNTTTYANAIATMENTVSQMEVLSQPTICRLPPATDTTNSGGGTGYRATDQG